MTNKFVLSLPENGFGFPCNICRNNQAPVEECRDCVGYSGPFVVDKSDIAHLMERRDNVEPHTENSL